MPIAVLPPSQWGVANSLRNPVFDLFLRGVSEACDEVGANLVIVPDRDDHSGIRNALADGFIFNRIEHLNEVEHARLRGLPYAIVDFDPDHRLAAVRVDARAGCYVATRYLIERGHRNFAILSFLRKPGAGTAIWPR